MGPAGRPASTAIDGAALQRAASHRPRGKVAAPVHAARTDG